MLYTLTLHNVMSNTDGPQLNDGSLETFQLYNGIKTLHIQ